VRAQVQAVARRLGCSAEDWALLRRVTRVYVCPACHKIKNFHITARDAVQGAKARACGYEKVVHASPLDGRGACTLSCANTEACRSHVLSEHDILASCEGGGGVRGGVLQTATNCITVSPCCGVLVHHGLVAATAEGYSCPCCAP
jgi:hypothetical protein